MSSDVNLLKMLDFLNLMLAYGRKLLYKILKFYFEKNKN